MANEPAGVTDGAVERIHRLWVEAQVTWNLEPCLEHLEPDVTIFSGDGSVIRGIAALQAEWALLGDAASAARWQLDITDEVVWTSVDAGWVVYEFHYRGILDGEAFDQRGRGSELYRTRDGRWRMAVGHWSWKK